MRKKQKRIQKKKEEYPMCGMRKEGLVRCAVCGKVFDGKKAQIMKWCYICSDRCMRKFLETHRSLRPIDYWL